VLQILCLRRFQPLTKALHFHYVCLSVLLSVPCQHRGSFCLLQRRLNGFFDDICLREIIAINCLHFGRNWNTDRYDRKFESTSNRRRHLASDFFENRRTDGEWHHPAIWRGARFAAPDISCLCVCFGVYSYFRCIRPRLTVKERLQKFIEYLYSPRVVAAIKKGKNRNSKRTNSDVTELS